MNEQATITRKWLEMQIKALDASMWQVSADGAEAQAKAQQAQAKLAELNGSKRAYEWMLGMLEKGKLGMMKQPGESAEPGNG